MRSVRALRGADMHGTFGRPAHVLIVEDDPTIRHMLSEYLADHDMCVSAVPGRRAMTQQFAREKPDLVILDVRLGQDDGFEVLREIRSRSNVPVIIASGQRCDEIDRVIGLELGADYYVTKPFGLRELLARIRALLRRQYSGSATSQRGLEHSLYRFGNWQLDRHSRRLTRTDGTVVALTKGEYALLVAFLDAPGEPLSREQLLQATRIHEDVFDRSIDVQVLRLRRKLETDVHAPRIIQTRRGVGYVFALPVEANLRADSSLIPMSQLS